MISNDVTATIMPKPKIYAIRIFISYLCLSSDFSSLTNDELMFHIGAGSKIMVHIYKISLFFKISFVNVGHSNTISA